MTMNPVTDATTAATGSLQEAVQVAMIKRGENNDAATTAKLLASVSQAPAAPRPSAPGVGTLIDVQA
jgi:hypothetical protein